MAAAGSLGFPVVAADVSATRRMIDHKYGTGQSVLDGILRATNTLVAGKTVVVAGFGPCGSGVAERARGLGAQVIVTEVDPVRALGAIMQGFRVMPMSAAAPVAELVITATGSREVVGAAELAALPDGAMLANAGHFDVEIDVAALAGLAIEVNPAVRPHAAEYVLADGRRLILLAEGRVVNLVAGEGNPAAAMDTSFAVQALALAWLAETDPQAASWRPGARSPGRDRCRGGQPDPGLAGHQDRRADPRTTEIPGLLAARLLTGRRQACGVRRHAGRLRSQIVIICLIPAPGLALTVIGRRHSAVGSQRGADGAERRGPP